MGNFTIFDIFMIPFQLMIIFFTLYYFFISWFGLFGKKKEVMDETKYWYLEGNKIIRGLL